MLTASMVHDVEVVLCAKLEGLDGLGLNIKMFLIPEISIFRFTVLLVVSIGFLQYHLELFAA